MKRYFFLIALVVVCASCKREKQPEPTPEGAKGVINIEVLRPNGDPITGAFQISGYESLPGSSVAYSGNNAAVSFRADKGVSLSSTDLSITVSGENILNPKTESINVPSLPAGQEKDLSFKVYVGENSKEWRCEEQTTKGARVVVKRSLLSNSNYATYDYLLGDVSSWYVNNTAYMLTGRVSMDFKEGFSEGYDVELHDYAGFEGMAAGAWLEDKKAASLSDYTLNYTFRVSAWAMWNVVVMTYSTPKTQTLLAVKLDEKGNPTGEKVVLASVTNDEADYSYGCEELPYPKADGQYVEGKGLEGGPENAGGDIVEVHAD